MTRPLTIAVIGAECTGKTTLCRALAARFGGGWVSEALREFVDRHGRPPRAEEQAALLHEQVTRERFAEAQAGAAAQPLVAFDSAPLVTALYSRLYFADDSLLAQATGHHLRYDLTLLADIDLPWLPDGLQRDGADVRARFHTLLTGWLQANALACTWVRGDGEARIEAAAATISAMLAAR